MHNTAKKKTQAKTREQRAAEKLRANERARRAPGIFGLEILVNDLYRPDRGFATKKPRDDAWTFVKSTAGAYEIKRHVEQKESLAVTWGKHANVRVIDVDAHDGRGVESILPVVWNHVQALHLGRGRALPDFTGGKLPTKNPDNSPVLLDGIIVRTERGGAHYMERLESSDEKTGYADKMRVAACLERYHAPMHLGITEVMPNENGGSRLPLGHGCEFIWPPVGKVSLEEGIEILSSLRPVPREFSDFPFEVPRRDQDITTAEFIECTTVDEEPICEYDSDEPTYPSPSSVSQNCVPMREAQIYEGGDVPKRAESSSKGPSEFTVEAQRVRVEGAARGKRNREMYNQVFLLRCTKGMSRDAVVAAMTEWMDEAPHTSADLTDKSKRIEMIKQVHRLLKNIDAKLASGQLYQLGASCSLASWDPLLLRVDSDAELAAFIEVGKTELCRAADGSSMLDGLPAWLQASLPALVGAIKRYTVGGKIMMPRAALDAYARTKKPKKCPFTGQEKPAYIVLLETAQRFGIIGGLISAGKAAKHKASVYESNIEEEAHDDGNKDAGAVDPAGRVQEAESSGGTQAVRGSGEAWYAANETGGTADEMVGRTDEDRAWDACADVQGAVALSCDDSAGQPPKHVGDQRMLSSKVRRGSSGRGEAAPTHDSHARRHDPGDGDVRAFSRRVAIG